MTGKRPRWSMPLVISGSEPPARCLPGDGVPADGLPADGAPPNGRAAHGTPASVAAPPAFEPRRALRGPPLDTPEHAAGEQGLRAPALGPAAFLQNTVLQSVPAPYPVRRALVVDDDPEVRRALARFLRPELDVRLASSVSDAKLVLAGLDRLDVAFVDWELPDGTGEQILEWLSRWPDAIRVLISARFTSRDISSSEMPVGAVRISGAVPTSSITPPSVAAPSVPTPSVPAPGSDLSSRRAAAGAPSDEAPSASSWPNAPSIESGERPCERSVENLLKNRALANLVLGKPVATNVIEALKRAALALPHD